MYSRLKEGTVRYSLRAAVWEKAVLIVGPAFVVSLLIATASDLPRLTLVCGILLAAFLIGGALIHLTAHATITDTNLIVRWRVFKRREINFDEIDEISYRKGEVITLKLHNGCRVKLPNTTRGKEAFMRYLMQRIPEFQSEEMLDSLREGDQVG